VRVFIIISLTAVLSAPALAQDVKLPRAKPVIEKPSAPASAPAAAPLRPDGSAPRPPAIPMEEFAAEPADPQAAASATPDAVSACRARISGRTAVIAPLPDLAGPGDCGATDVVRLEAVIQPDKSQLPVTPPATMRCEMAEAVADWVREDLMPALAPQGIVARSLDNYASYDCRGRNRQAGARISQHGLANAIDIRGVTSPNGRLTDFTDRSLDRGLRETIRKSMCERFTTVLGPGSDGFHETHIHIDLTLRRGGYRICQWAILDPAEAVPLPRPRPAEAP
jgi:hypothetical protein